MPAPHVQPSMRMLSMELVSCTSSTTTGVGAEGAGSGDVALTLPTEQTPRQLRSPAPLADRQPDIAPNSHSIFRCIPCDCHTTLVHSPMLAFASSFSAGYLVLSLLFGLSTSYLHLPFPPPPVLGLKSCSYLRDRAIRFTNVAAMCAANADFDDEAELDTLIWGQFNKYPIYLVAIILAFLINNKWLKCTACPKTSCCADVALCLLTGITGFAAVFATMVEQSACFSCELDLPSVWNSLANILANGVRQANQVTATGREPTRDEVSLHITVMRFESSLGVITSLFLLIAVAWMVLGRVARMASMKLFRGHACLTDERASTIRHLLTSRVYVSLLIGLLLNIVVVIYYESILRKAMETGSAGVPTPPVVLYFFILLYVQLAVCALASAFNGWKHLQHWRTVIKVAPAQVAPAPAEHSPGEADGLDAEHSHLIHVGSKSLMSASRLPGFMCSSLAIGSFLIALVLSAIITALYTWSVDEGFRTAAAPAVESLGSTLAVLVSGVFARMVLARCLLHAKQREAGGNVLPMKRPICFAWFEVYFLFVGIFEGVWIGTKRLVIAFVHTTASLLRTDRPSYAEGHIVYDKVFRSYAAVLCLERDAEACRRQAGATHFDSGVLAVKSNVRGRHTCLWCLACLVAGSTPGLVYYMILTASGGTLPGQVE